MPGLFAYVDEQVGCCLLRQGRARRQDRDAEEDRQPQRDPCR